MNRLLFSFIFSFILISSASAQSTGKLTGKLNDEATGEPLMFANLLLEGTTLGTSTDLDGNFFIDNIPPGTYNLRASYAGYATKLITGIQIKAGETVTKVFALSEATEVLGEIVVEAQKVSNTEGAILAMRKNSINVSEGISAQEMSDLGAGNAAESMKSVTGVAVEDGKYMVVRGLGDRYSVTQLNNITLPSADPYRNSSSMDLIPADMVDNIVALKTFTPDQPGNFTGGMVDIKSKSYPEKFYLNFKTSAGYNTNASLNPNFLVDGSRGKTDWIGKDDGTRALDPYLNSHLEDIRTIGGAASLATKARRLSGVDEREILDGTAKAFNTDFIANKQTAPLDHSIEFSIGDRLKLFKNKVNPIGYNVGLNYGRNFSYFDNGDYGLYEIRDGTSSELVGQQVFKTTKSIESPQYGGIVSLAYQFKKNHELSFTKIYNHDASITNQIADGSWIELGGPLFNTRGTLFTERSISSSQLMGKHVFKKLNDIELNWIGSKVVSSQNEPDIRYMAYTYVLDSTGNDTAYALRKSLHDLPTTFYRSLTDVQYSFKADLKIPIRKERKLADYVKAGYGFSHKDRTFNEQRFELVSSGQRESTNWSSFEETGGDVRKFLSVDNAGVVQVDKDANGNPTNYWMGNFYASTTILANSYVGYEQISSYYAMLVYSLSKRLQTIAGVRLETTDMKATSNDTTKIPGSIQTKDFLPSLNLIYKKNDKTNIRLSATKTLARPNMREISPFASIGGIGAPIVIGNPELTRTIVYNFDARYEVYPKPGELFAVSVYFKQFNNPIVWQLTPVASVAELKPINVPTAIVYGAELEYRKNLDFISKNLKMSTNLSYTYSRVDKGQEELDALENSNRPDFKDYRPFQGQSPYIANLNLSYSLDSIKWRNTLTFNIFGPRLAFVTDALTPDIYEKPRPSLNFNTSKQVKKFTFSFKVTNIFNMKYLKQYSYGGNVYTYERFQLGRTFGFSIAYKI